MKPSGQTSFTARGSWLPYMCPCCRGLIRAKSIHSGPMECPLCDGSFTVPVVTTPEKAPDIAPLERGHMERPQTNQWEKNESQHSQRKQAIPTALLVGAFLISAVLVGAGIFFLQDEKNADQTLTKKKTAQGLTFEPETKVELTASDLEQAQEVATKFLNTASIEEFPEFIRDPQRVMPLVREYYAATPYQALGASVVGEAGMAQVSKNFTSFQVVLKDHSSAPIAVEMTEDGPRVDWESWVSYCERPWETFIEEKVTEPTTVRVTLKADSYYNFDFRDDSKWACFELYRSPDEEVLYGYIPRESALLKDLPKFGRAAQTYILRIRFPDESRSQNQVIITDVLQEGWVIGLSH